MKIYRVIDANINRVSEGIRVLEDFYRFVLDDRAISKELRDLRHLVRKTYSSKNLIKYRDSKKDVGKETSKESKLDNKTTTEELVVANFKRVQEGLRSIEESLKIIGLYEEAKEYEVMRFKSYDLEKKIYIKRKFIETDIYGITGEEFGNGRNSVEIARELVKAGVKVIQYREKNKSKLEKYRDCYAIRKLTEMEDVVFIVNDDVDIALSVGADGIHIGQQDMPISMVRDMVGTMLIGVSTHKPEQAIKAQEEGADYIGVGPIFSTNTKQNIEASEGLKYVKWVSENIEIPQVNIGGIKEENVLEVKQNGGKCFAMISEIINKEDVENKVKSIRSKLNEWER